MTGTRRAALLTLSLTLAAGSADAALRCRNWDGLSDEQKQERILQEIDAVLSSNAAKRYQVNKVQIRKCLEWRTQDIVDDLDGVCAEGKSLPMNAMDRKFDSYISSCVARRKP